jgi:glycosyltransferase involved in cell wall biosynthesis
MGTLIIPVYKNRESLPDLLEALSGLNSSLNNELRVTFVIDASPDSSEEYLLDHLPAEPYPSMVIRHSRNFGSFAAVRTGLEHSPGEYFAVMAADLQEPPSLVKEIFEALKAGQADVVLGNRLSRDDPFVSSLLSNLYWSIYRKYLFPDIPKGGVDIFGCNAMVKSSIARFSETRSSLIGQLMWVGYKRKVIGYERAKRQHGVSAWTLKKKIDYFLDSIFAFSDLPIRLLLVFGFLGVSFSLGLALIIVISRTLGLIQVSGYSAIMLAICFFGALNLLGMGIVGTYAQRAYDNSKGRPLSIVSNIIEIPARNKIT